MGQLIDVAQLIASAECVCPPGAEHGEACERAILRRILGRLPPKATIPHDGTRRAVSILQACRLAGVSRRTIYNWMHDGKVETFRTTGGRVRIFADTLFGGDPRPRPMQRAE